MLKNHKNQYSLNKYDEDNIVYKYCDDSIYKLTYEEYIKSNPDGTKNKFLELKKFSDEMFLVESRQEAYNRKYIVNIEDVNESKLVGSVNKCLSNDVIERLNLNEKNINLKNDKTLIKKLFKIINNEEIFTEIQRRRFIKYFLKKRNIKDIAIEENRCISSVWESIYLIRKKLAIHFL